MKLDCNGNGAFIRPWSVLLFRFSELDFLSFSHQISKKNGGKGPTGPPTIMILSLDNSKNISFSPYKFLGRDSPLLRDPGSKMPWSLSRAHVFKDNFKSNFKDNFKSMMWNDMEPVISEPTKWSGSLTCLATDLGQAHQKYVCTVHF